MIILVTTNVVLLFAAVNCTINRQRFCCVFTAIAAFCCCSLTISATLYCLIYKTLHPAAAAAALRAALGQQQRESAAAAVAAAARKHVGQLAQRFKGWGQQQQQQQGQGHRGG